MNTHKDESCILSPEKNRRYDLFISFHSSEILSQIKDAPDTRQFVRKYLIPAMHKKWNIVNNRKGELAIFFGGLSSDSNIKNDIFSGILQLQV